MNVSLDIDNDYEDMKVTIHCKDVDGSIKEILDYLKEIETEFIVEKNDDMQHILGPNNIHYFHTEDDAAFDTTYTRTFKLKEKLHLAQQTALHFITVAVLYFILPLGIGWISFDVKWILLSACLFIEIYSIMWTCFYPYFKNEAKKLNDKLQHI